MAQTGVTLYKYLQQVVGQAYSGYLNTFKADRIFKDALLKTIELKYQSQEDTKNLDELTTVITTNNVYTPANNLLSTQPLQVASVVIASAVSFEITTVLPHNLTTGQSVTNAGIAGTLTMNTANGTFVVTVTTTTKFTITVASATGVHTANTGYVTTPTTISNYWHLLSMKVKFNKPIYDLGVSDATNASPIVVTLDWHNTIRSGESITIAGVVGNLGANGTYYAKQLNTRKVALYSDKNLQTPVAGTGIYVSGGTLSKTFYNYVTSYAPEQKIASIVDPSVDLPGVETANNLLKIYPLDATCLEATIDYIKIPEKLIVTTDNVTDLTQYYPEKFLLLVVNAAAQLFAEQVRDTELYQQMNVEKIQNP